MTVQACYSVYLPLRGDESAAQLGACLQSLADQSWQPARVVAVFRGVLPEALDAVLAQSETQLPLVRAALAEGADWGSVLAAGVEQAEGEYAAHAEASSVSQPWRFERQVGFLAQNPQFDICGARLFEADVNLQPKVRRAAPEKDTAILAMLPYRNPFNHATVVLRRDKALAAGNYGGPPLAEDYDLWLRMLAQGSGWNLQDDLVLHDAIAPGLAAPRWPQQVRSEYRLYRTKRRLRIAGMLSGPWVFLARSLAHLVHALSRPRARRH
ncbi:hypothetical protein FOZ76_20845 [Verticiella sediminum]|uniref:Glycosyltransferase n=1 Tax=Verticiella sediminum TaxID=1247510 RepID=A0A556ABN0_9BURK|nr:hypothetical protein [Verticiella sediminum]TSH90280.1 hypothetical protein FOZ76_20845 [Verticiella sediminum]